MIPAALRTNLAKAAGAGAVALAVPLVATFGASKCFPAEQFARGYLGPEGTPDAFQLARWRRLLAAIHLR